jgi:hypothetical protein
MLRDVRSWDPDIEGLVEAISRGELAGRISAETGVSRAREPRVSMAAAVIEDLPG